MRSSSTSLKSSVWIVVLCLALALPVIALGQGAANPTFARIQQGAGIEGAVVTCTTSVTPLFNCPVPTPPWGDFRSITCLNDGSTKVQICPKCTCVSADQLVSLEAGTSFTFGASSRELSLSCITASGTTTVRCIGER